MPQRRHHKGRNHCWRLRARAIALIAARWMVNTLLGQDAAEGIASMRAGLRPLGEAVLSGCLSAGRLPELTDMTLGWCFSRLINTKVSIWRGDDL